MKRKCFVFGFLLLSISTIVSAQDDPLISRFKLNYAVPDLPAFKALGNEPSNLLRPSTPEDLSIIISDFSNGKNVILPKTFAAEIAPFMLFMDPHATLQDYQKHAVRNTFRISIGAFRDSLEVSKAAIGFRIALIDEGDLKNDKEFLIRLRDLLSNLVRKKDFFRDEYLRKNNITEEDYGDNKEIQKQVEEYVKSRIDEETDKDTDKQIEEIKEKYRRENWNKEKLEIAAAFVGNSSDSLAQNLKFERLNIWIVNAFPLGKKAQCVLGGSMSIFKNPSNKNKYFTGVVGSRIYIGKNHIKGFIETQYSFDQLNDSHHLLLNAGSEISVKDGLWINFYGGMERNLTNKTYSPVTNLDVRFTLPENFQLF